MTVLPIVSLNVVSHGDLLKKFCTNVDWKWIVHSTLVNICVQILYISDVQMLIDKEAYSLSISCVAASHQGAQI